MTTCDVCETANDSSLTFCRHCGNRLKAKSASAAVAEEPAEPPARRSRPPAPALELKGRKRRKAPRLRANPDSPGEREPRREPARRAEEPKAERAEPPPPTVPREPDDAESEAEARRRCGRCGAGNPRGYRFCISCGAVLAATGEVRPYKPDAADKGTTNVGGVGQQDGAQVQRDRSQRDKEATLKAQELEGAAQEDERARKQAELQRVRDHAEQRRARDTAERAERAARKAKRKERRQQEDAAEPFPLADRADKHQGWHQRRENTEQSRAVEPPPKENVISGQLVIIVEDGSEGQRLDLRGERVDLGRTEGDIVLPEDRYLSPRHARFYRSGERWYVRDLTSFNGVYRRLRQRATLRDGDRILLGLEVLELDILGEQERSLRQAIQHGVLAFGSPATKRRARLLQRTVEGVVRDVYHLVATETTIGRETGDIVFTSDPFMSRRHAAISWDDQARTFSLTDLGSSNGTYLAIREEVALQHGDYIRLGQHLFRVDLPRRAKSR